MKLILQETVDNLGEPGDLVDVKAGYGRNYLLPQGLAVVATAANERMVEELRSKRDEREEAAKISAQALAVSLTGYFLCSRQALRSMIEGDRSGCILNIGSIAGMSGVGRGNFPYSTAKAGVVQLTRELAVEYAREGVRVNAILPAQVLTPALKRLLFDDPRFGEKIRRQFLTGIPLGRLLEPEDFVGPAVFLCSDAAAAVTGVLLPVDGGNLALNAGGSHTWPVE